MARIQIHMTLRQLQKKLEVQNTLLRQEVAVRKQAEAALKEAHDELKAQYQQAQKMETVGIMAGGVAHDFNNLWLAGCEKFSMARSAAAKYGERQMSIAATNNSTGLSKLPNCTVFTAIGGQRAML